MLGNIIDRIIFDFNAQDGKQAVVNYKNVMLDLKNYKNGYYYLIYHTNNNKYFEKLLIVK